MQNKMWNYKTALKWIITLTCIGSTWSQDQFQFNKNFHDTRMKFNYKEYQTIDHAVLSEDQMYLAEEFLDSLPWIHKKSSDDAKLQLNLTTACDEDFRLYIETITDWPGDGTGWAIRMADSTGKVESGIIDGNTLHEGRYPQCRSAVEKFPDAPVKPLYCLSFWTNLLPIPEPPNIRLFIRGLGICIPDTCTDEDAEDLVRNVYNIALRDSKDIRMICRREEKPVTEDAEAMISIIILSLFGLLALLASIFDVYKRNKDSCKNVQLKLNDKRAETEKAVVTTENFVKASFHSNELSEKEGSKTNDNNNENVFKQYETLEATKANNNENEFKQYETLDAKELPSPALKLKQTGTAVVFDMQSLDKPRKRYNMENDQAESKDVKSGIAAKMLLSFSLYKNVPLIVSATQAPGTIGCLNGMRFIAMSCVILGHTYAMGYNVMENPKVAVNAYRDPSKAKLVSMGLYVDTFFILSGFLVSLSFLRQLKSCNGNLGFGRLGLHYFNRYWRLTPTYFIVLMIYTNLFHFFVNGPFAPPYYEDVDSCSTEWWKNLLYVNNLFHGGTFCLGLSWYLAIDMQLFIIAPVFLYLLYRWEQIGILSVVLGFCGGIISNIVLFNKYYNQQEVGEMDIFADIYIKPWTRCPVYFMGMLLAYFFYRTGGKIKMPKVVVFLGWMTALSMYFITAYVPALDGCVHDTVVRHACQWTTAGKVTWSTLVRPMWGIWVCWLILACASGYGGIINTFLSWNFFIPLGRLTYLGYLTHALLLLVFYHSLPIQFYYTDYITIYVYFATLTVTHLVSLVLCTTVSAPLVQLAAVFLPARKAKGVR